MKDIRSTLRSYLLADPTVNGLVGGSRIYYGRLEQNQTNPSVVFHKISDIGDYHLAGSSGLVQTRMQFDSWALNSDQATQLAGAVYDRLSGAALVDFGSQSMDVRGIFMAAGLDDFDEISKLFRCSRDYIIWYGASF